MELIKKYQGFIAIGLAAIGLVALVALSSNNKADETNKTGDDAKTTQTDGKDADKTATTEADKAAASAVYNYTAQAGDSYTVLARKAVQTYGVNEKVQLTQAQIIAAETQLTVNAGSIELNEGQTVAIAKSAVKAAVDAAKKLSADVLAAWEVYVPYVDFNTSAAGQPQTK
jgi:hypothetical protein